MHFSGSWIMECLLFIIRAVNSDMPIDILTEQMSEKIKCPELDSNPRHPSLMEQMFIIREVNSDMPIYILTEQMSEKIKCPERDSNPRHPDLIEGALTTELPRQPQWSESNICYNVSCIFYRLGLFFIRFVILFFCVTVSTLLLTT